MRGPSLSFVLIAFLALAGVCQAETLSYSYSLVQSPVTVTGTDEDFGGVPLFDPDLGTLLSVTQTLTADYTFTPTTAGAFYSFNVNGPDTPITTLVIGSASEDLDYSVTSGPTLEEASGAFGQQYVIDPFDITTSGGTLVFSTPVTDTFTFDYTPAATPEPSSLVLLATGLLGAVLLGRRRRADQLR